MTFKLRALLVLSLLALASTAGALQTDDLLAVSAMPLAVADVVALPDLPRDDFMTVVTTLNQAEVPAPQFIEIVRYVPVALVEPSEPRFVTYVTQEYERGLVGEPLAVAIAERYNSYGINEVQIVNPPVVTFIERQEFVAPLVATRFQPVEFDPLALVAMPLAVAAVSEIADVPQSDLMQLVTWLNQAMVPAPQFVEVVRYSPVVFVDRAATPQFMQFVTTEVDRGVVGRPLAFRIAERIDTFQPVDIDVVRPQPMLVVERNEILPPVVFTRAAKAHPHGGPPGQLKKQLGLQTGAEVVHGSRPTVTTRTRVVDVDRDRGKGRDRQKTVRPKAAKHSQRGETRVRVERPKVVAPVMQPQVQVQQDRAPKVKHHGGGKHGGGGGGEHRGGGHSGGGKGKGKKG